MSIQSDDEMDLRYSITGKPAKCKVTRKNSAIVIGGNEGYSIVLNSSHSELSQFR